MKNKKLGLCSRCKKNKATLTYAESMTDFTHGFSQEICQNCYDEIKHANIWYQGGRKEALGVFEKILSNLVKEDIISIQLQETINKQLQENEK